MPRNAIITVLLGSLIAAALPAGGWAFVAFQGGALAEAREVAPMVEVADLPELDEGPEEAVGAFGDDVVANAEGLVEAAPTNAQDAEALPTAIAFETTMASYETRYHDVAAHRGRAHNVQLAAAKLDGAIIAPHGRLSFNEHVGPRTAATGFRQA